MSDEAVNTEALNRATEDLIELNKRVAQVTGLRAERVIDMTDNEPTALVVLQEVWDLGDKLDSNHARYAAGTIAEKYDVPIRIHNDFSDPPRNRNQEDIDRLERERDALAYAVGDFLDAHDNQYAGRDDTLEEEQQAIEKMRSARQQIRW